MNIVFEGPKGTGKSTAINRVKAILNNDNMEVVHSTKDSPNDYEYYNSLTQNENTIFDRFSLGELVYPIVYDRERKMSGLQVFDTLDSKNIDYIFFTYSSDPSILINRVRERDDDVNIKEIIDSNKIFMDLYDILSKEDDKPFIFVDIAKESLLVVVEEMLGWYN